ncbi:MAG: ATP-binding cassette domain-containing protein [Bdellovibrionales bacterium]
MSIAEIEIESVAVQDLCFGYEQRAILQEATCELPCHKIVRLSGMAGAGKSSILRLLVGLSQPSAGTILINGQAVDQMSFEEFLPYRLQIGYGFDLYGLLNNRTLRENLALPLQYHKRFELDEINRRVDEMLDLFHLVREQNQRPSAVSGSQRKATCVARSLIMMPQILLLDDPTTGLSILAKAALCDWIKAQMKNKKLRYVVICSEDQNWLNQLNHVDLELADMKLVWSTNSSQKAEVA